MSIDLDDFLFTLAFELCLLEMSKRTSYGNIKIGRWRTLDCESVPFSLGSHVLYKTRRPSLLFFLLLQQYQFSMRQESQHRQNGRLSINPAYARRE